MKNVIIAFVSLITLFSCNRQFVRDYRTVDYERLAGSHKMIAVLPAQVITTGRTPKELTPQDLITIDSFESVSFQISLYHRLAQLSGDRIRVNFQHYHETNLKLADAGISIHDSWRMKPQELAQLLGVDAVVHSSVEKEFYLSNLESLGIYAGARILTAITGHFYSPINNKTSDVFVSCEVVEATEGTTIWVSRSKCPTSWNRPQREVIEKLTARMCYRFPYRE